MAATLFPAPTITAAGKTFVLGERLSDIPPAQLAIFQGVTPPVVASLPTTTETIDFRTLFSLYVDNQGQTDQCVGESIAGANYIAVGCQGQRGSHRGIYTDGRSRENIRKGDTLTDGGVQSYDAYDAICSTGIYPLDARDDDLSQLNAYDTWDESVARVPVPVNALIPLQMGDTTSVTTWLLQRKATAFSLALDSSYAALTAANPMWTGMTGPQSGYHRQVAVGITLYNGVLCYIVWNSWGTGWGDSGFSYIPITVFAKIALDMVIHIGGVQL